MQEQHKKLKTDLEECEKRIRAVAEEHAEALSKECRAALKKPVMLLEEAEGLMLKIKTLKSLYEPGVLRHHIVHSWSEELSDIKKAYATRAMIRAKAKDPQKFDEFEASVHALRPEVHPGACEPYHMMRELFELVLANMSEELNTKEWVLQVLDDNSEDDAPRTVVESYFQLTEFADQMLKLN